MEEYPNIRKHTLSLKIHSFTGKTITFHSYANFQSWLPKETRTQVLRTGIQGQELKFYGPWGQSAEAAPLVKTKEESNVSGHIYKGLMAYFWIEIKHWTH